MTYDENTIEFYERSVLELCGSVVLIVLDNFSDYYVGILELGDYWKTGEFTFRENKNAEIGLKLHELKHIEELSITPEQFKECKTWNV